MIRARHRQGFNLDVLIVGAGPTGLALAMQLRRFGGRFRIIDKLDDRTRESRALAVQARSLELLQMLGWAKLWSLAATPALASSCTWKAERWRP